MYIKTGSTSKLYLNEHNNYKRDHFSITFDRNNIIFRLNAYKQLLKSKTNTIIVNFLHSIMR